MLGQDRPRDSESKTKLHLRMLAICLVLNILAVRAWDKDNSACNLKDYQVNVTQEALCCQSLQPNKARN